MHTADKQTRIPELWRTPTAQYSNTWVIFVQVIFLPFGKIMCKLREFIENPPQILPSIQTAQLISDFRAQEEGSGEEGQSPLWVQIGTTVYGIAKSHFLPQPRKWPWRQADSPTQKQQAHTSLDVPQRYLTSAILSLSLKSQDTTKSCPHSYHNQTRKACTLRTPSQNSSWAFARNIGF